VSEFSKFADAIKQAYSADVIEEFLTQPSPFRFNATIKSLEDDPPSLLTTFDLLIPQMIARMPIMGRREWKRDPRTGFPICKRGSYDENRGVLSVWLKHEGGMMHLRLWFEEENGEWVMKAGGW
jgi:hypothetical protein